MSHYGGSGPMVNAVLWVTAGVGAVFVGLRVFTRLKILHSVGWDDHFIVLAWMVHVIYVALTHKSAAEGLGRTFADIGDPVQYSEATKWEVFGQTAGLLAIGIGKLSVGFFLLRIVRNKIQIGIIWFSIAATIFITLFASIGVIVQCVPVEKTWNPTAPGHCWLDFPKLGMTIGVWFVLVDFAFAILPWFIIWDLNMKRKEKITVACGLSLGVFAGVCGIVRTVALTGLNTQEYIYDTVGMLIWSGVESVVTMMCSTIPVLRPLYARIRYGSKGDSYAKSNSYAMPKYGSEPKYGLSSSDRNHQRSHSHSHHAVVTYGADNASDESILRSTKGQPVTGSGIKKTHEVSVSYEISKV